MNKSITALFAFITAGSLSLVSSFIFESGPLRFTINFLIVFTTALIFSKVNQKNQQENKENNYYH